MAQRAVAVGGIERFAAYLGSIAEMKPDVVDKFNADQSADEYALAIGVPSKIIVPDEDVAKLRQERAAQQERMQMQEALKDIGPTAVQAAGVDVGGQSAAAAVLQPGEG